VYRFTLLGIRNTIVSTSLSNSLSAKSNLRREMIARRDALPPDIRSAAAEGIAAHPFPLPIQTGAIVSGFMPMKSEINPLPLMKKLADAGVQLALPVTGRRGQPLTMRAWTWGDPLVSGVWGIREPKAEAPQADPDILLVPLLAFDRAGRRLGYGGGYYDLTLAHLRSGKPVIAVGLAYGVQEITAVPTTPRDATLDLVLTEREVIDLRS
jgi:5-formyltetrahydrofolate cyclo-ligase